MTWDRRLYFPSEGRRAEDFFALKIWWLRLGLKPWTWVLNASTLPLDHRSPYILQLILSLQRENHTISACDSKLDISHSAEMAKFCLWLSQLPEHFLNQTWPLCLLWEGTFECKALQKPCNSQVMTLHITVQNKLWHLRGRRKIMGFLVFSPYIKGDDFSYREWFNILAYCEFFFLPNIH